MYFSIDISVFMFLLLLVSGYNFTGFILLELYFIVILFYILHSTSMERFGAQWYLRYFSLVTRFMFVSVVRFEVICVLMIIVILSKLPIFGLHMWLPKVHVEASILRSVFLAAIVLKAGSLFYYISCYPLPLMLVICIVSLCILSYVDGKGIVAMSSVVHISVVVIVVSVV